MTELTLLLPVPGMRLEVRILGFWTARFVLGHRGLLQGMSLASLEARRRPPRPFGCGGC